jgi:Phage portal protein
LSLGSRIKGAWRALTRAGPAGYGMGVSWSGGPLYSDAFGAKRGPSPWQLIEAYKQINFACTEFNALGTAILPMRLYCASGLGAAKPRPPSGPRSVQRSEIERLLKLPYIRRTFNSKDVEDVHEITNHLIIDAWERPAVDPDTGMSYFDRPSMVATLSRYIDTTGLAYLKPESEDGVGLIDLVASKVVPPLLWPLQAQYVRPIRTGNSALIQKFGYFSDFYLPGDLIWFRLRPSLRDPYGAGYSASQAAWQYSGLEDKGISMWDELLGAGARPNLVVSPKDENSAWGPDERKRFLNELNTYHSRGRAGRAIGTDGSIDFQPINYQGFDTGEMQTLIYNMERMCNCYGVPISFMTRETNLANFQAGRTFHAQFGIEPRAQCIASAFTDLVRRYDPRLFVAFDGAIGEDKEVEARIMLEKVKAGLVTGNEANSEEPWDPKPYLEEPWIPNNLVQPTMAVEKHEQGLESAKAAAEKANAPNAGAKPGTGGQKPGGDRSGHSDQGRARNLRYRAAERKILVRTNRILKELEKELGR